jgi:hypothetical protein
MKKSFMKLESFLEPLGRILYMWHTHLPKREKKNRTSLDLHNHFAN